MKKRATKEFINSQIGRMFDAFPGKEDALYEAIATRIEANGFTEETLARAIDHVIDSVEPYRLSVASVIKAKREIEEYEATRFELHPALRDEH